MNIVHLVVHIINFVEVGMEFADEGGVMEVISKLEKL